MFLHYVTQSASGGFISQGAVGAAAPYWLRIFVPKAAFFRVKSL